MTSRNNNTCTTAGNEEERIIDKKKKDRFFAYFRYKRCVHGEREWGGRRVSWSRARLRGVRARKRRQSARDSPSAPCPSARIALTRALIPPVRRSDIMTVRGIGDVDVTIMAPPHQKPSTSAAEDLVAAASGRATTGTQRGPRSPPDTVGRENWRLAQHQASVTNNNNCASEAVAGGCCTARTYCNAMFRPFAGAFDKPHVRPMSIFRYTFKIL